MIGPVVEHQAQGILESEPAELASRDLGLGLGPQEAAALAGEAKAVEGGGASHSYE